MLLHLFDGPNLDWIPAKINKRLIKLRPQVLSVAHKYIKFTLFSRHHLYLQQQQNGCVGSLTADGVTPVAAMELGVLSNRTWGLLETGVSTQHIQDFSRRMFKGKWYLEVSGEEAAAARQKCALMVWQQNKCQQLLGQGSSHIACNPRQAIILKILSIYKCGIARHPGGHGDWVGKVEFNSHHNNESTRQTNWSEPIYSSVKTLLVRLYQESAHRAR